VSSYKLVFHKIRERKNPHLHQQNGTTEVVVAFMFALRNCLQKISRVSHYSIISRWK